DALKATEIVVDAEPAPVEGKNGIDRHLAGQVQHTAAAAIDPSHRPVAMLEFLRLKKYVGAAASPAHSNQRRMLTQKQRSAGTIAGRLVYEQALQGERGVERNRAEQVRLQGRFGGGQAR